MTSIPFDGAELTVDVACRELPNYRQCEVSGTLLVALFGCLALLTVCCLVCICVCCVCASRRRRDGSYAPLNSEVGTYHAHTRRGYGAIRP